jgi:hypothetical protein
MTDTLTNEQRSALEVARFKSGEHLTDGLGGYFAYWNNRGRWHNPGVAATLIRGDLITTWTGELLGTITWTGHVWGTNFGDRRQNFRAKCVDGRTYSGTAYLTAGDYVRMRAVKPGIWESSATR